MPGSWYEVDSTGLYPTERYYPPCRLCLDSVVESDVDCERCILIVAFADEIGYFLNNRLRNIKLGPFPCKYSKILRNPTGPWQMEY